MASRPDKLKFHGEYGPDGQPLTFYADIPARDLTAEDIAFISDERLAEIQQAPEGGKALYVAPGASQKAQAKTDDAKPAAKADDKKD